MERKVLATLRKNPDGASISDISEQADLARATVARYLEMIQKTGQARPIQADMAKLCRAEKATRESERRMDQ